MYYGGIKDCDVANGPGVRVTLFVSGCTNHCEGCFQPQTWDFCYGEPFTGETEERLLRMLRPAYIRGLTVLGGEPFEPENQRALLPLGGKLPRVLAVDEKYDLIPMGADERGLSHKLISPSRINHRREHRGNIVAADVHTMLLKITLP